MNERRAPKEKRKRKKKMLTQRLRGTGLLECLLQKDIKQIFPRKKNGEILQKSRENKRGNEKKGEREKKKSKKKREKKSKLKGWRMYASNGHLGVVQLFLEKK